MVILASSLTVVILIFASLLIGILATSYDGNEDKEKPNYALKRYTTWAISILFMIFFLLYLYTLFKIVTRLKERYREQFRKLRCKILGSAILMIITILAKIILRGLLFNDAYFNWIN
jgi:hypothetical protein